MDCLQIFLDCLPIRSQADDVTPLIRPPSHIINDKASLFSTTYPQTHQTSPILTPSPSNPPLPPYPTQHAIIATAASISHALQTATKAGNDLDATIQSFLAHNIHPSWFEAVAKAVLTTLAKAIEDGSPMRGAMAEAFEKANVAAKEIVEIARKHPYATAAVCVVLALGVLVVLAPGVVGLLGFGTAGPVEGSFAAAWQSSYGGWVEAGSLFAYLQSLGMLWV